MLLPRSLDQIFRRVGGQSDIEPQSNTNNCKIAANDDQCDILVSNWQIYACSCQPMFQPIYENQNS